MVKISHLTSIGRFFYLLQAKSTFSVFFSANGTSANLHNKYLKTSGYIADKMSLVRCLCLILMAIRYFDLKLDKYTWKALPFFQCTESPEGRGEPGKTSRNL